MKHKVTNTILEITPDGLPYSSPSGVFQLGRFKLEFNSNTFYRPPNLVPARSGGEANGASNPQMQHGMGRKAVNLRKKIPYSFGRRVILFIRNNACILKDTTWKSLIKSGEVSGVLAN